MPDSVGRSAMPSALATVGLAAAVPAGATALWHVGQKLGKQYADDAVVALSRAPRNGALGALVATEIALVSNYLHKPTDIVDAGVQGALIAGGTAATVPLVKMLVSDGYVRTITSQGPAMSAVKLVGGAGSWAISAGIVGAVAGAALYGLKGSN